MESGKLGQITYARVHNYHNGSVAPQADGSLGWLPPHFYDEVQTGGGAMMDLGAHPMYTLHWFLGGAQKRGVPVYPGDPPGRGGQRRVCAGV